MKPISTYSPVRLIDNAKRAAAVPRQAMTAAVAAICIALLALLVSLVRHGA